MKFKNLIDTFSKSPTQENMHLLVSYVEKKPVQNYDIAYLAEILANSGQKIKLDKNIKTADIPSTGGPSSLSTLICPLFLVEFGYKVPKVSVPGSPAGGIDILSQIKDYKIHFSKEEYINLLDNNNFVHTLADKVFCPLDILLFKFRKKVNKLNLFPFVISSLLAKKIALGVHTVGLDIRVSEKGNFGTDFEKARENAIRFNEVAKLLSIATKCFITDARYPLQPFIGRGEALSAVYNILESKSTKSLKDHLNMCISMSMSTVNVKNINSLNFSHIKKHFQQNISAQGSNYNNFLKKVREIEQERTIPIIAQSNGFVEINLQKLKTVIVKGQNIFKSKYCEFPDPCGCILNVKHGTFLKKGDIIAFARISNGIRTKILEEMKNSFTISNFITKTITYEEVK